MTIAEYHRSTLKRTSIAWTQCSWNPLRGVAPGRVHAGVSHMCVMASLAECGGCYASAWNQRLGSGLPYLEPGRAWDPTIAGGGLVRLDRRVLEEPCRMPTGRLVFVVDMTDLFGEWVPDAWIVEIFEAMRAAPQHTYQLLTKRARRLAELAPRLQWTPNIWMGVSVGSDSFTWRVNHYLAQVPAAVRWASLEPLVAAVPSLDMSLLDWVVVGGESQQPRMRPPQRMDPVWARDVLRRCRATNTAFFFKQTGTVLAREWKLPPKPRAGATITGFPEEWADLAERSWPLGLQWEVLEP